MSFVDEVPRLKTNGIEKAKRKTTVFMDTNGSLTPEKPAATIEIKTSDILTGVGIIIAIVLCVLAVQKYNKNKQRRLNLRKQTQDEIGIDDSNVRFQENKNICKTTTVPIFPKKSIHFYDQMETEYHDKNWCICSQSKQPPVCSNESRDVGIHSFPLDFKESTFSFGLRNHVSRNQTSEMHVIPRTCTSETCLNSISKEHYIEPVFVCSDTNPNNISKSHSYVDIIN